MSEYLSKKAVLEFIKSRKAKFAGSYKDIEYGAYLELETIETHIESGAFDAPEMEHINAYWAREGLIKHQEAEVQRLRAIEQAIRDFQPTKEQQAGYDALVVWLESTTPFVLDPNVLIDELKEKEDQT